MGRLRLAVLLALLTALLIGVRPPLAYAGEWVTGSVTNEYGTRSYRLWVPAGYDGNRPVPLVMMLHGCSQTAESFAVDTQMSEVAEREGFLVLFPEQSAAANAGQCWNWFDPAHQARGAGEPSLLALMVTTLQESYAVDARRVYVAGMSAGGAMAVIMGATYPDLFQAIGVSAGLEYRAGSDTASGVVAMQAGGPDPNTQGLLAYQAMGAQARRMRVIVFHGTLDQTVRPVNADQIIAQWAQTNDLVDDQTDNNTVTATPATTMTGSVPDGRTFSVRTYLDRKGRLLMEQWLVDGMTHKWSGGAPGQTYADPQGPDASEEMWRFFTQSREHVWIPLVSQ